MLSLKDGENTQLILIWLDRSSASNLNTYLSMGIEITELSKYGCVSENGTVGTKPSIGTNGKWASLT